MFNFVLLRTHTESSQQSCEHYKYAISTEVHGRPPNVGTTELVLSFLFRFFLFPVKHRVSSAREFVNHFQDAHYKTSEAMPVHSKE